MEERFAQIEQRLQSLQQENGQLREELGALQLDHGRLLEQLSSYQAEVLHLRDKLAILEADADQLRIALTGHHPSETAEEAESPVGLLKGRLRRRWPLVAVALTIAVPLVALSVWHLDTFWSTTLGFLHGILLYYIGPRAWFLLIEGAFRAIPGVLFGQATRIAVDKFRERRSKSG